MAEIRIVVNKKPHSVVASPETPLLYVLTNELRLRGPRFGCGLGQCGACSVLVDGTERRSCITPVAAVRGRSVTTLEGIPAWYAAERKLRSVPELHPVQQAIVDEQAVQCGYCYNGIIVKASELLAKTRRPTVQHIKAAMRGHLCRCGTYPRLLKAIQKAADLMARSDA